MAADGSGMVEKSKVRSLTFYLDALKPERFAEGHKVLPLVQAILGEVKNKLAQISIKAPRGEIEGTSDQWIELRKKYLDAFEAAEQQLALNEKRAINVIDECFNLPLSFPDV